MGPGYAVRPAPMGHQRSIQENSHGPPSVCPPANAHQSGDGEDRGRLRAATSAIPAITPGRGRRDQRAWGTSPAREETVVSAARANGLASPHRRRAALVLLLALLVVVLVVHAAPTPPAFWTVHVGQTPGALAVDARYGRLLVADSADRSVHLLDARSGALLATIPLGTAPAALALDETHGRAFTLNGCAVSPSIAALCSAGGSSMSVLDLRRGTLLDTVGMAPGAAALAVDEQADRLAAASGRRLRTIAVGGSPVAIAAASRLGHVFLSSDDVGTGQGRVLMLDSATGTLLSTQPVGPSAGLVLSDARAGRVLAAGETGLRVLDARTGRMLRDITAGGLPLAIDGGDGRALIATQGHLRLLATRDDRKSVV